MVKLTKLNQIYINFKYTFFIEINTIYLTVRNVHKTKTKYNKKITNFLAIKETIIFLYSDTLIA